MRVDGASGNKRPRPRFQAASRPGSGRPGPGGSEKGIRGRRTGAGKGRRFALLLPEPPERILNG